MAQAVKHPPATWETQVQTLGGEDPLEKGMPTHSSILAWRIPWAEEVWEDSCIFVCEKKPEKRKSLKIQARRNGESRSWTGQRDRCGCMGGGLLQAEGQRWVTESFVSLPSCVFLAMHSDRSYLLVLLCCHGTEILLKEKDGRDFNYQNFLQRWVAMPLKYSWAHPPHLTGRTVTTKPSPLAIMGLLSHEEPPPKKHLKRII